MHTRTFRTGRFVGILVVIAFLGASLPHAAAQSDELAGVTGNT